MASDDKLRTQPKAEVRTRLNKKVPHTCLEPVADTLTLAKSLERTLVKNGMTQYEDLLNQLISRLRTSLDTKATEEQLREAAETLIALAEPIDAPILRSVGIIVLGSSQALAKANPKLLNTIIQQARAAQIKESIRRTWGPN
jgi:hypothetical protein